MPPPTSRPKSNKVEPTLFECLLCPALPTLGRLGDHLREAHPAVAVEMDAALATFNDAYGKAVARVYDPSKVVYPLPAP